MMQCCAQPQNKGDTCWDDAHERADKAGKDFQSAALLLDRCDCRRTGHAIEQVTVHELHGPALGLPLRLPAPAAS